MRTLLLPLVLLAGSLGLARADGARYTPLVDINDVDVACRPLARVPTTAQVAGPSYDAAISTASCLASVRTRWLVVTPTAESVRELDFAIAPAIAILDRVIATGDAEHALIARFAELDLYNGCAARVLASLPKISPQMTRAEVIARDKAVQSADQLIQPWRRRAIASRRQIAVLVARAPGLAQRNDTLAYMISNSRIVEAIGLASR